MAAAKSREETNFIDQKIKSCFQSAQSIEPAFWTGDQVQQCQEIRK